MKLSLLLTSIIAFFVGTSLSIRINAPARHFHRRAIERPPTTQRPPSSLLSPSPSEFHQEFIERHEKFTETLSQVAATIQEAQDGLAEMEMIEAGSVTAGFDNPDVISRLSQGPGSEEMVDASEQPKSRGVTDVENEGTCRHPKDVNCKSTEDELTSDLNNDEGDMKPLILDALTQRSREEGVENIQKVELETGMEKQNISEETSTNATITEESSNNTTVDLFQEVNSSKIVDTSDDRSDETANQIIVDEVEFEELPTDPKPTNSSSLFAKLVKLFKDNSHVILGL